MTAIDMICLILVGALTIYLCYALLRPEKFQ